MGRYILYFNIWKELEENKEDLNPYLLEQIELYFDIINFKIQIMEDRERSL